MTYNNFPTHSTMISKSSLQPTSEFAYTFPLLLPSTEYVKHVKVRCKKQQSGSIHFFLLSASSSTSTSPIISAHVSLPVSDFI